MCIGGGGGGGGEGGGLQNVFKNCAWVYGEGFTVEHLFAYDRELNSLQYLFAVPVGDPRKYNFIMYNSFYVARNINHTRYKL